jgi:hypothetical protein
MGTNLKVSGGTIRSIKIQIKNANRQKIEYNIFLCVWISLFENRQIGLILN